MKKFITLTLAFCLIFSCFTVTSSAATGNKKYTKVKTATYLKYKKAYNNQKKLKKRIKVLENNLAAKQIDYKEAVNDAEKAKEELEYAKSMNSWVWMNIKSMGISYSNKTWTVPSNPPEKFMINGTTYKVVIETEGEE